MMRLLKIKKEFAYLLKKSFQDVFVIEEGELPFFNVNLNEIPHKFTDLDLHEIDNEIKSILKIN
jgi:hypothetical protein